MYIRLAFSIATSVDPDILIIDEALSVGDNYFQKKCIDRLINFKESGKTILFCSHSIYYVNQLCQKAIWLKNGIIFKQGAAADVTSTYEDYSRDRIAFCKKQKDGLPAEKKSSPFTIKAIKLNGHNSATSITTGDDLFVEIHYVSTSDRPFMISAGFKRNDELICHAVSMQRDGLPLLQGRGENSLVIKYSEVPLLHGTFFTVAMILDEHGLHIFDQKTSAPVTISPDSDWKPEIGLLRMKYEWQLPA